MPPWAAPPGAAARGLPLPGADLPRSPLQHDHVRSPVPGGPAARHLQLQAGGRQRRPGREGDQRPQPLHRDEGPGDRGLHRVQVDALRHRHLRASLPARRRAREDRPPGGRGRALPLLRSLRPLVLRLQDVPLRTPPRPQGGGEGRALHAPALRLQEARELRGVLVPAARLVRPARLAASPAPAPRFFLAWRQWRRRSGASPGDSIGARASKRLLAAAPRLRPAPCAALARGPRRWRPCGPGALEGRPAPPRLAAPGADRRALRPGRRSRWSRATTGRPGHRQAAPAGGARRSRGSWARGRAASSGSAPPTSPSRASDRRTARGRPGPGFRGGPQLGPPRPPSATLEIGGALFGVYLREASGAVVERCRVRGIPGREPGEKGSGIHAYNMDGLPVRGERGGGGARRPLPPERLHGHPARQRGPGRPLRPALHVLRRQPVRGQHVRERGGGHRHHVLEAHRVPAQPLPAQPRIRLGGPAVPDLRRRPGRGQPRGRQRPRRLHRGLVPDHPAAQRDRGLRRGGRALRSGRRPPFRGQLLRGEQDPPRPRGPPHRHRVRGQLLVGPWRARPRRRRPRPTGPTGCRPSSTTSAAISPRPTCSRTASPPRPSARPSARSPSCG